MTDEEKSGAPIKDIRSLLGELEPILQSVVLNDSTIIDALAQLLGALQHMNARSETRDAQISDLLKKIDLMLTEDRLVR
jgi:hypothetical protein